MLSRRNLFWALPAMLVAPKLVAPSPAKLPTLQPVEKPERTPEWVTDPDALHAIHETFWRDALKYKAPL